MPAAEAVCQLRGLEGVRAGAAAGDHPRCDRPYARPTSALRASLEFPPPHAPWLAPRRQSAAGLRMDRGRVAHRGAPLQAAGADVPGRGHRVVTSSAIWAENAQAAAPCGGVVVGVGRRRGSVWCAPSPGPTPARSLCSTRPAARSAAELVMARARWSCGPRRRATARRADVHAAAPLPPSAPARDAATPPRRAPQCLSCRRPLSCRLCRSSPHERPRALPAP